MESQEKFRSTIIETGIVETKFASGILLEKEDLVNLVSENRQLMRDDFYCHLLIGSNSNITKEAREFSAKKQNLKNTIARAIHVRTIPQKILANMYLKINKPKIPTRVFDDREKALNWLRVVYRFTELSRDQSINQLPEEIM